jgi:hypothetical protein
MARVFLSYRRDDTAAYAGRLYDRLVAHFGANQVFIDIDQIEPGEDFVEVINQKVSETRALAVLIGRHWLDATNVEGKRRLDDPEDFVRLEVKAALDRGLKVIPVLLGGATMPRAQQLPEALASLSRRNAIEISDTRFHHDVDRLIEALERQVSAAVPIAPRPGDSVQETPSHTESSDSAKTAVHASPPLSAARPVAPDVVEQAEIQREGEQLASSGAEQFKRRRLVMIAASIGAVLIVALGTGVVRNPFAGWGGPSIDDLARQKDAWVEAFKKENPAATKADLDFANGELYRLGEYRGLSVGRNWLFATNSYADAAAEGHIAAHVHLVNLFNEGTGEPKGEDAALVKYLLDRAKNGDKPAELQTALAYEFGLGVAQSYAEAMRWHVSAADRGNVYSAYRVGEMYRLGLGVEQDAGKAIPWYQKAAARGYEEAETRLKELGQPPTRPASARE